MLPSHMSVQRKGLASKPKVDEREKNKIETRKREHKTMNESQRHRSRRCFVEASVSHTREKGKTTSVTYRKKKY
jgi:hypothetical protein